MTTMSPTVRTATTVGDVLATVHETWMEQVATNLAPALSDEADFWSRWAVVRFLSDPFGDRFRLECALLDELDPLLPVEVTGTLASARAGTRAHDGGSDDCGSPARDRIPHGAPHPPVHR